MSIALDTARAVGATTDRARLIVYLSDERVLTVPLAWFPRLSYATTEERAEVRLVGGGIGLHWPALDLDVSIEGLLAGRRSTESEASLNRWREEMQRHRQETVIKEPQAISYSKTGMGSLTTIEGIGDILAGKFKEAGIGSARALLEAGSTPKGRKELTEKTGIDAKRILRFVNHADLMRIKGVGGEYAELLKAADINTVAELARRNADNLQAKMVEINAEKKLVRQVASAAQVADWIEQAKELPRIITY